ncbi:MAG TPA: hypothetical protein VGJ53_16530 [Micromonosporaceae bacterium]
MLLRRAKSWLRASRRWAASNCSWPTMAGMVATGIQAARGSSTRLSCGRPIGWVDERRIRGGRERNRPAKTWPV